MIHPYEPSLEVLEKLWADLLCQPSTDENMKKVRALEVQIERHKAEKRNKP